MDKEMKVIVELTFQVTKGGEFRLKDFRQIKNKPVKKDPVTTWKMMRLIK